MISFKRTNTITGKIKGVVVTEDGVLVDNETGEPIDLGAVLHEQYGNRVFDISTSLKVEEDN